MGQSHSVSTEVEIQASPEAVRSIFFDFPRYKRWCKWRIEPAVAGKNSSELEAKDVLKVNLDGMLFSPTLVENSADCFAWLGSLPYIFTGRHEFYFNPSTKTPGGTTAVQIEHFTGLLAFLVGPGWSFRRKTLAIWDEFFADMKKEAEKSAT